MELRKLLKTDNIYPKYNDFKRYIIHRAQKELKKLTDLSLVYYLHLYFQFLYRYLLKIEQMLSK